MRIGFIGLGQMGSAIAANLAKAGHEVTVWNRSSEKADPLVRAGATLARRPVDAAQGDLVMTMLADDHAVVDVVFGEGGIAGAPALHIGHSTISVALADRLAEENGGGGYVSAPVFGRPPAAAAGKLFVVAAGAPAALDRCEPVFAQIGQRTFRIGDTPSAANLVKLSGNFMIMAAVEAMAEAMAFREGRHRSSHPFGGADRNAVRRASLSDLWRNPGRGSLQTGGFRSTSGAEGHDLGRYRRHLIRSLDAAAWDCS